MQNSFNFDKMLPCLTALTPKKPPFFCTIWLYLIRKSVFEVLTADLYVALHSLYTHKACYCKCSTLFRTST